MTDRELIAIMAAILAGDNPERGAWLGYAIDASNLLTAANRVYVEREVLGRKWRDEVISEREQKDAPPTPAS